MQNPLSFSEISVGMQFSYGQTISDVDVRAFSGISGDKNPIYMSDEYALLSRYNKRIVHGLISANYFSAIFGMKFPDLDCVYASQPLNILRPVYIGDPVNSIATVTAVDIEKRRTF